MRALAKAKRMTEGQSAECRCKKTSRNHNVGGKPTNVKTFAKRKR